MGTSPAPQVQRGIVNRGAGGRCRCRHGQVTRVVEFNPARRMTGRQFDVQGTLNIFRKREAPALTHGADTLTV